MIGGQAADIGGTRENSGLEKTTALTRLTMAAGAAAAGAESGDAELLAEFGHALGEAYQICDDIADAFGNDLELGKTAGQDDRHGRGSAVTELGRDAACEYARDLVERACRRLRNRFGDREPVALLEEFARSIVVRGYELVH